MSVAVFHVGSGAMSHLARIFGLVLALVIPLSCAAGQTIGFERDAIVIETKDGTRHRFSVELAITRQQQSRGLMFRRELAADAGMLFLHKPARVASMWMRNTIIPLDMLFIGEAGRIDKIVQRTVPQSLRTISSDRPVAAVLELDGGSASRLGIATGDRVIYKAFESGS